MLSKLKALWTVVIAQLADIWNRSKMVLLAIGALIVTLEFQKLKEFLLVYAGKKELQADQTKSDTLGVQESSENKQADTLVAKAANESVADDWNKDQK
jgi:hypothetical protein